MFLSSHLQLLQHGCGHRHSCCRHQVCTSVAIIKNVEWRADQISARCLSNPLEVANGFTQASHTVTMACRARLATQTSAMKYTRTKNEKEIKKQEIKNLKTICKAKMASATDKETQFHFFEWHAPHHNSKFIAREKMEEDARPWQWRKGWEFVLIAIKKLKMSVSEIKNGNKKRTWQQVDGR